jgi:hypothetical protein
MSHYAPDVDIAALDLKGLRRGRWYGEDHPWGLVCRDSETGETVGFEIWDASTRLPPELLDALPKLEGDEVTVGASDLRSTPSTQ